MKLSNLHKSAQAKIMDQTFLLHPARAIYWLEKSVLLVADLHLGKEAHFRKAGLAIPDSGMLSNLANLNGLLKLFRPRSVVFLGDLFHSIYNRSWEQFGRLLDSHVHIDFHLVSGNHDILPEEHYRKTKLIIHPEALDSEPFLFTHKPEPQLVPGRYNLAGHLHPGVRLKGRGKQSIKLPCYWFGQHQGVLPAFGRFTGLALVRPKPTDQVFVVLKQQVMAV